mmetsp:Transcript_4839/g.10956  ORF Transcript_4839/g.10956 Transcript_4839/m.10956 type:complete len:209 (-) Transcript_4839:54-680(-)
MTAAPRRRHNASSSGAAGARPGLPKQTRHHYEEANHSRKEASSGSGPASTEDQKAPVKLREEAVQELLDPWLKQLDQPGQRQLWADVEDPWYLADGPKPETSQEEPNGATDGGRDLASRRLLGPRGGRKPKFPSSSSQLSSVTHGCLPAGSCRNGLARGRQRSAADVPVGVAPRASCGKLRGPPTGGAHVVTSSKPRSSKASGNTQER